MTRDFRFDFAGFVLSAAIVALPACAVITSFARDARPGSANIFTHPEKTKGLGSLDPANVSAGVTPRRDADLALSSSGLHIRRGLGEASMARAQGFEDAAAWKDTQRLALAGTRSPEPALVVAGIKPGRHLLNLAGTYEVTAYSHTCVLPRIGPERPPQRAANGRWPIADVTVAADRSIPFGTELLIEGLGFRTVGDRGAAIKGLRLDLFVDSCREAIKFGRRMLRVYPVPAETTKEARW